MPAGPARNTGSKRVKKPGRPWIIKDLGIKLKVCAVLIIIIIVISAVSPAIVDKVKDKTGATKDYEVKEVMSMAASAFDQAKAAVADASDTLSQQEVS